jgi:hypothetical protein
MVNQVVVDYIIKARQAGLPDEQIKSVLYKNGWTEADVSENLIAVSMPEQESVINHSVPIQRASVEEKPVQNYIPKEMHQEKKGHHLIFMASIILISVIIILCTAGYFLFLSFSAKTEITPVVVDNIENEIPEPKPIPLLLTEKIITISQDYDASKISIVAFSNITKRVAYCAQQKDTAEIACFFGDEKLSNAYSYKPYWIGISPDHKRVVFLYLDPIKRQSFVFEDGVESIRYDGTITFPKFSTDSQNFMYTVLGKNNKNFIVLNGNPGMLYDKIYNTPEFSSDNKYIIYGARNGQDLFWVADKMQ